MLSPVCFAPRKDPSEEDRGENENDGAVEICEDPVPPEPLRPLEVETPPEPRELLDDPPIEPPRDALLEPPPLDAPPPECPPPKLPPPDERWAKTKRGREQLRTAAMTREERRIKHLETGSAGSHSDRSCRS